ncbi:MAG: ATP-binding protein [Gammaproteobacteria bacterium]|nr:ATP-binding protein [Gammaproteobacteria bacterium]
MTKIFNRGIVFGEGFCNRTQETQQLLANVNNITHTLLISPRRYGKTSLALHAVEQAKLPYAHIDLFMKYDKEVIIEEFCQGVGCLLAKIISPGEKAIRIIESLFKNLKVALMLGDKGLEFSLTPVVTKKQDNIKLLLLGVNDLLIKHKKHAIIFIDEIQTITESGVSDEIEASLRFVAQKTQNISFIFSGSSRHLLGKIFEDRSRPFYKLCQRMDLQRIGDTHYKKFINKFARKKWQQNLKDEELREIFYLTKNHSYYLNILCEKLFTQAKIPDLEIINECWYLVCQEEQSAVAKDMEFLTPKQKHLLSEMAKAIDLKEPTGKAFIDKVNLTPRGVSQAIEILMKHDLIEKLPDGSYRIIDPVLEYWLQ